MTTERTDDVWNDIERTLDALAKQQETRVLALARRLRGDLTAEDLRNAHDFRELDDHDFHYEDGTLAGLLAALSAVRARRNEVER